MVTCLACSLVYSWHVEVSLPSWHVDGTLGMLTGGVASPTNVATRKAQKALHHANVLLGCMTAVLDNVPRCWANCSNPH